MNQAFMRERYSLILFALNRDLLSEKLISFSFNSIKGENVPPEINDNHNFIGFENNCL